MTPDPRFATGRAAMQEQNGATYGDGDGSAPELESMGAGPVRDIFDQISPPLRLLMCEPRYLGSENVPEALKEFGRLQRILTALDAEISLMPPVPECQYQSYTSSVAVAIEPYIILANFQDPGRAVEIEPARAFFESLGYQCIQPPYEFGGEADLKRVADGVYIGGYGQFTDIQAIQWIEQQTGIEVVPVHYVGQTYLERSLLVVDEAVALINGNDLDANSVKAIEQILEIVEMPASSEQYTGAILVPEKRICVASMNAPDWMNKTFDLLGYACAFLETDDFTGPGADLSAFAMCLYFDPEATNGATPKQEPESAAQSATGA